MAKSSLDQESLFSLEVVVDTLTLNSKIACRFPAVAFRLLDFPTLLVYHVEPDLGSTIKTKVNADPSYKLPNQLSELQDRHGNFLVRKGKSCLFKVSANTLQAHLQTTPLYVMLIDTYPDVPKLIASCTVPLDSCVDEIYDDICNLGISVPSTHGERGEYNLNNLMGKDVGNIVLGIRLLSLGVGLLSHLPESSVAKLQKKGVVSANTEPKSLAKTDKPTEDVVLYDLEALDKPVQVAISPEPKKVEDFQGQTDHHLLSNTGTQTFKTKKKHAKKFLETSSKVRDDIDDYFITNTECPPPLFFNSEKEIPNSQSLLLSHYPMGLPAQQHASQESDSDEESIRDEDRFSDSESELKSQQMFKPKRRDFNPKEVNIAKKPPAPQIQGNLTQLPILNALLQEIMCLQGQPTTGLPGAVSKLVAKGHPALSSPAKSKAQETPRPQSPGRKHYEFPHETQAELASRLSSPRHAPPGKPQPRPSSPVGMRKHDCAGGHPEEVATAQAATKNKGWLRHAQPIAVPKTKMQPPGMTNTQRLRLAKTNPQLLASLEREEEERQNKRRQQMQKKWGGQKFGAADVSTEISRHQSTTVITRPYVPALDLSDAFDTRHHKKPVPTPRHSVNTQEVHESDDEVEYLDEPPPITPRHTKQKKQALPDRDMRQRKQSLQERDSRLRKQSIPERDYGNKRQMIPERDTNGESSHSEPHSSRIEVHIPSAHSDAESEGTSMADSELASPRLAPRGIRRDNTPGFPLDSLEQYSEDFDPGSSTLPNTSQLLKGMSDYTGADDTRLNTNTLEGLSAGDELGLRCIVDKYSDDESSQRSKRSDHSSYHSAQSKQSNISQNGNGKLTIPESLKPSSSVLSPDTFNDSHHQAPRQSSLATRQPFTAVSLGEAASNTQDSTAYINRSQVMSQVSVDSTSTRGDNVSSSMQPKPSPRTPRIQKNISIRTDSISSYVPSDQENTSPLSPLADHDDIYSDNFEDYSDEEESEIIVKPKYMKDIKVDPNAKLGYTWSY